jgi:hypothetical protein
MLCISYFVFIYHLSFASFISSNEHHEFPRHVVDLFATNCLSNDKAGRIQSITKSDYGFYNLLFSKIIILCNIVWKNRDSAVDILTDYALDDPGVGVPVPAGLIILHMIPTCSGIRPFSFSGCIEDGT